MSEPDISLAITEHVLVSQWSLTDNQPGLAGKNISLLRMERNPDTSPTPPPSPRNSGYR